MAKFVLGALAGAGLVIAGGLATDRLQLSKPEPVEETAAPSTDAAPAYAGVYVRRPTLVVSDMDRALQLYRDTLGMELGQLSEDPPESYVYDTFNIPAGTKVMHATLDTDRQVRALSLVEVRGAAWQAGENGVRPGAILFNANGRLDDIVETLEAENYEMEPMHALGETGREIAFLDRDGHAIVLYQFPPRP